MPKKGGMNMKGKKGGEKEQKATVPKIEELGPEQGVIDLKVDLIHPF